MEGIGGGLTALAFWGFVASVVVAGIWSDIRKREAQHETMRRMIESGQPIDQALMDKLSGGDQHVDRDLKIAGLIILFIAPGLAGFGWFVSLLSEKWLFPMLGIAALTAFVGVGLLVASKFAERSYREAEASTANRTLAP